VRRVCWQLATVGAGLAYAVVRRPHGGVWEALWCCGCGALCSRQNAREVAVPDAILTAKLHPADVGIDGA
jgi:hypothetical protein